MERVLAVFISGQQVGRGAHPLCTDSSSSSRIRVKRFHLVNEYIHTYIRQKRNYDPCVLFY